MLATKASIAACGGPREGPVHIEEIHVLLQLFKPSLKSSTTDLRKSSDGPGCDGQSFTIKR